MKGLLVPLELRMDNIYKIKYLLKYDQKIYTFLKGTEAFIIKEGNDLLFL